MQDLLTLHRLALIDRDEIEQRVRLLFEAGVAGLETRLLACMSPGAVYEVVGTSNGYPHSGRREGIAAIRDMLHARNINFQNLGSTLHDVLIDGENVAVRRTARMRHRGTNAVGDVGLIDLLSFRDGMLIKFSEFPDTAAVARLAGELAFD